MKFKQLSIALLAALVGVSSASAVEVTVKMNGVSPFMTMTHKDTGTPVEVGSPANNLYTFTADPGEYIITGYGKDGTTENGTIEVCVGDSIAQQITVLTLTAYVNNKTDGKTWTVDDGDYTIEPVVNSREGVNHPITLGNSVTAGRKTFLALNGDTYSCAFVPSAAHIAEGYTTLYKQGTLTANVNVSGNIPIAEDFTITVPKDARFELNMKFFHFIDFTPVEPIKEVVEGDTKTLTYHLAQGQIYNFRTSMPGKLTQGGYFMMHANPAYRPKLNFKMSDYEAFGPKTIKHDVHANQGYETGDIFVNINKEGHLNLNVGDTFLAHAMRTWQLTDNSTNNYFIEPDFHYTILDLDGKESNSIVQVEQKEGSAWANLKAVGAGTAIVLVTYDAIGLNYYSSSTGAKTPYLGGEYWSAIWPENTAAYVVTVGQGEAAVVPHMLVNEKHNQGALKLAGEYVDAEHDVFYYLDSEQGYSYTFKADNAAAVKMAYPTIGEQMATYTGFSTEGVTVNADGSYSVLLKEGRQIVQMTDANGKSVYQVLTAKKCHRNIVNTSRPNSKIFQPGDQVQIQYTGLRHPANKLAGIYNMSAYVTYNGVPNGTSLILSANQYTFGSSDKAQTVTMDIPADYDTNAEPVLSFTDGVIQVNGFGDPIGNHRNIDPKAGRSPNFTAVPHKTYFGAIPDVQIPITPVKKFPIRINFNLEHGNLAVTYRGTKLEPDADGLYEGSYGLYDIVAGAPGYRCCRQQFSIDDDAEGLQTFTVVPVKMDDNWYGTNTIEPTKNDNGYYVIASAAELAWLRDKVNTDEPAAKAVLTRDIDLGDYDWNPMGVSSPKPFSGELVGGGHNIYGLYINRPSANSQGLVGCLKGADADHRARITGISVHGYICGNATVGAIAAFVDRYADVDTCANYATIQGIKSQIGGITGNFSQESSTLHNCFNAGDIHAESWRGGLIGLYGCPAENAVVNVFNVGEIENHGSASHAIAYYTNAKIDLIQNAYAIADYGKTGGYTLVDNDRMASGEIAYKLGKAFGQKIGTDPYPRFGAPEVLYNPATGTYYNNDSDGVDNIGEDTGAIPTLYYNLQGVASETPWHGLNIVRLSDGSVRKVFVK